MEEIEGINVKKINTIFIFSTLHLFIYFMLLWVDSLGVEVLNADMLSVYLTLCFGYADVIDWKLKLAFHFSVLDYSYTYFHFSFKTL